MEEIFTQLQIRGYNNIEQLIKWMAKARVIDPSKRDTERWLVEHFRDVPDSKNITFAKFKEIVTSFAEHQNKSIEEITAKLIKEIPSVLDDVVDSHPGIYVATPGSEKLAIYSRLTVCSNTSTITDYSQLINQDGSNGEVVGSSCSTGAVAVGSNDEVPAGSKGDATNCNIHVVTSSSYAEFSDTSTSSSSGDSTPQTCRSDEGSRM
ncbi:uncharacterized protein LOC118280400 [Spodoptera frugiperda]|uniref:SFRICE_006739 n=1 Tax=Spodoptera frugiperda TaxID=7108 RepID=A0A2H1VH41_SPOFR|nr:uncharacterized protein LOC118280400 [Spodoptera frugiperda]